MFRMRALVINVRNAPVPPPIDRMRPYELRGIPGDVVAGAAGEMYAFTGRTTQQRATTVRGDCVARPEWRV